VVQLNALIALPTS